MLETTTSILRSPLPPKPKRATKVRKATATPFSFTVPGEENAPVYKPGDRVHVDPGQPLEVGQDCLFLRQPACADGSEAVLGRLLRFTPMNWIVRQYAGDEHLLSRAEWPTAWPVVGRQRARRR